MKQIKILMLFVCFSFFGAVKAQVETTIEYVATYTWTGAASNLWNNTNNWSVTHNVTVVDPLLGVIPDPLFDPALFPNVINTAGAEPIHNVIIPSGLGRYPTMQFTALNTIFRVTNLDLQTGATLNLGGRTLVINGSLTGDGQFIGGPIGNRESNLEIDGLSKVSILRNPAEHNATFNGAFYFNNFNAGPFGELNGGNAGEPLEGTDFPAQNLFSFNATAAPGGLYVFQKAVIPGILNDSVSVQLSTLVELDELVLTFTGAPVYTVSGNFSVTDFDYTPMSLGKIVEFNAGVPTPTITNDVDIVVSLADGSSFTYTANASGEFVGFTAQQPILSITVAGGVFIDGLQNVGFSTVDNIKFGTRGPVGTLYMSQASATSNKLGNFTVNVNDAASTIGGLTLGNQLVVSSILTPSSGIINATPIATNVSNLVLSSNETETVSIAPHTVAGRIDGNVTVQRYFPSFDAFSQTNRNKQWRFLGFPYSSPLLIGDITGINSSLVAPTMMQFREFFNTNSTYGNGAVRNNGYSNFTSNASALPSLNGLVAWIYDLGTETPTTGSLSAAQTMQSVGNLLESGDPVTKLLSYTEGEQNLVNDKGWNLISNPFASTIDWTLVTKSNINGTIYRWDPQAASWTTYNELTNTGTGTWDNLIESGSSFFVKANSLIPAPSITFGQDAKLVGVNSVLNQFGKNGSKLDLAQQKVGAKQKPAVAGLRFKASGTGNPIPAEAYLGLSFNDATEGFDSKYDAFNKGRASGANVAIQGQDKNNYTMQFDRPITENGKEKRYYPLTVTVPSAGKTKLEMNIEGSWNSLNKVYLIDNKEGKTIPLTGNKLSYEFTMATTEASDRFTLAINHVNVAEKSGITATDVRVMNNPVRADVIDAIIAHPTAKAKSYSVVNASGATVNKGSIEDNNSVQHRLGFGKSNTNGVMYLRVNFENGDSKTVKFIKL
jgi:hypothetical protein